MVSVENMETIKKKTRSSEPTKWSIQINSGMLIRLANFLSSEQVKKITTHESCIRTVRDFLFLETDGNN